jgi:putative endonuclease
MIGVMAGKDGEDVAALYLVREGFKIVGRNIRYKFGEIDIVAMRRGDLHFVEVKSLNNVECTDPFEAVTAKKRSRIRRAASAYLMDPKNGIDERNLPVCHFDVVAVDLSDGDPKIECVYDAFY